MCRSCPPWLLCTNMSFCSMIVATICYVLFVLGCKLASQHVDPKSDPTIHIGNILVWKWNDTKNSSIIKEGHLYIGINYNEHVTSPLSILIMPKPQPFQQAVHALLGGCPWWQPPCPYYMVFDWHPCNLYKVICNHVVMKDGCVFALFHLNWQTRWEKYVRSWPSRGIDGSPSW